MNWRDDRWLVLAFGLFAVGGLFTVWFITAWLPFLFSVAGLLVLRQTGRNEPKIFWACFAFCAVIAGFSFLSGISLTDEPFSTPGYATFFPNIYGSQYIQTYNVPLWPDLWPLPLPHYTFTTISYDLYLPLISFIQIPYVPYQVVSMAAWLGTIYLCYHYGRFLGAVAMATPFAVLCAAAGFNDLVTLALLTASILIQTKSAAIFAQVVACGTKQFAPVISVAYHAIRRQWDRVGIAIAATVLILLPFYLIDPSGTYCHAILASASCSTTGGQLIDRFFHHLNYYLYPLWAVGLFHVTFARWTRQALSAILGGRAQRGGDQPSRL